MKYRLSAEVEVNVQFLGDDGVTVIVGVTVGVAVLVVVTVGVGV
jgi:hypothetical protein